MTKRNACKLSGMKKIAKTVLAALGVTLLGSLLLGESANAQRGSSYPPKYCLRTYDGSMDCAYFDLWQCRAAASFTGGDCAINSRFHGYPDPAAPRWKRTYR